MDTEPQTPPASAPAILLRNRLLDAMLDVAPEQGWTVAAVRAAAKQAGLSPGEAELAAPRGPVDLIDAFADRADQAMTDRLAKVDLKGLKVRERAALAVRARLEAIRDHRRAARRALFSIALRRDAGLATRLAWRTADRIWRALGDPSTDGNFYSKRAIMAGVYTSTLAIYLNDDSDGNVRTWFFLDARIENVMQFERVKAKLKPLGKLGEDAVGALANLRYGWNTRER